MIKDEYTIENDYPLMESINHYAKISNNDDYRYKFIEIMKRIEAEDVVFFRIYCYWKQNSNALLEYN